MDVRPFRSVLTSYLFAYVIVIFTNVKRNEMKILDFLLTDEDSLRLLLALPTGVLVFFMVEYTSTLIQNSHE